MFSFSLRFANEDTIKKRMEKVYKKYEQEYKDNIDFYKKLLAM